MAQTLKKRATTRSRQAQEAQMRRQIAQLLHITPDEIREWNTAICPDCRANTTQVAHCAANAVAHLSPLFYALAPEQPNGDMPLGVGADSYAALTDLLWNVKLDALLGRLADEL